MQDSALGAPAPWACEHGADWAMGRRPDQVRGKERNGLDIIMFVDLNPYHLGSRIPKLASLSENAFSYHFHRKARAPEDREYPPEEKPGLRQGKI